MDRLTFRAVADVSLSREILDAGLADKIRSVFKLRGEGGFDERMPVGGARGAHPEFETT